MLHAANRTLQIAHVEANLSSDASRLAVEVQLVIPRMHAGQSVCKEDGFDFCAQGLGQAEPSV